ncbi:type III pantothenate kinase [Candidatus Omnitrophota bacterium]
MYLLTIDIGNTTINLGLFAGKKLILSFKMPTGKKAAYRSSVVSALNKGKIKVKDISKVVLCSVVPKETAILKGMLSNIFQKKVLLVGSDIKVPIKNRYKNPKQVGKDRLVNAYAALKIFGPGLILVDFGTAITFDVVSKKGEYLGGLIFPGLDLSTDALKKKTALLPRITIKTPKSLIGKNTVSCINNGIIFGMAGACDGVIERLQKKFKGHKIIATGGSANFIKKYSKKIKTIHPHLTLEGLRILSSQ